MERQEEQVEHDLDHNPTRIIALVLVRFFKMICYLWVDTLMLSFERLEFLIQSRPWSVHGVLDSCVSGNLKRGVFRTAQIIYTGEYLNKMVLAWLLVPRKLWS